MGAIKMRPGSIQSLATSTPGMFAKYINGGEWKLYDHLKILDKAIMWAIANNKWIIVQMPPQHGKSMLISEHLPPWYLGKFPNRAVMLCSYEADYAMTWGRKARRLMERWGPKLFGVQVSKDSRAADNWEIAGHRGILQTAGVGGPVTGKRAHLLIIDDPVKNAEDANSPTMREKKKDWFRTTSSTRLQKDSAVILVQTRWHEDDLAGWLQREFPEQVVVINLPAIAWGEDELPEGEWVPDILGRKKGEALCPDLHPIENLLAKKVVMGEVWFSALYQGRPVPAEGGIFKKHTFKYWNWDSLPEKFDYIIQSWDMTYKRTSDSDWVVGQTWGAKGADRYLLSQFRERCGFSKTIKAVKCMTATEFGSMAREKLVEFRANGPAVVRALEREISGFVDVEPEGSKEARAHGVEFQLSSGNVYFPNPSEPGNEWVGHVLYEFTFFPNARYDDCVDCATQALDFLWDKGVEMGWGSVKKRYSVQKALSEGENGGNGIDGFGEESIERITAYERKLASRSAQEAIEEKRNQRRIKAGRKAKKKSPLSQILGI